MLCKYRRCYSILPIEYDGALEAPEAPSQFGANLLDESISFLRHSDVRMIPFWETTLTPNFKFSYFLSLRSHRFPTYYVTFKIS